MTEKAAKAERQVAALKQDLQLARHESERNIAVCSEANRVAEAAERQVLALREAVKEKAKFWDCYRQQPIRSFNADEPDKPQRWIDAENNLMTAWIRDLKELSSLLTDRSEEAEKKS